MMRKIADMPLGELHDFVRAHSACTEATTGQFTSPQQFQTAHKPSERFAQAAAMCGRCAVRPACLELAKRQPRDGLVNQIFGGYYFSSRVVINIRTGEQSPHTGFFNTKRRGS